MATTGKCPHGVTLWKHGQLHLEREQGCDELVCLACGIVLERHPCQCLQGCVSPLTKEA